MPDRPTTNASTSPSAPSAVHEPTGVATTITIEDEGRDQLDPRVEPVQRAGALAVPLQAVKPHRAWPLRFCRLQARLCAIPQPGAEDDQRADHARQRPSPTLA